MINNRFNVVYHLLGFVINLFYLYKKNINMEKEKKLFMMGVEFGRELQVDFDKNKDEIAKKYFTFLRWEAEQISQVYDEIKEKRPELFDSKQIND
jgi:hypothetical protein